MAGNEPWGHMKMIWDTLHEMRVEMIALRRCLLKAGVLDSTGLEIERHRARFEWYVERNPGAVTQNIVAEGLLKSIAGMLINSDGLMVNRLEAVSSGCKSVVSHLSRVYAVGGLDMQGKRPLGRIMQALDTVESLDVLSGDWDPLEPVASARMRAGAAVAAGKFYLLGGLAGERAIADVDCLDMLTGVWENGLPPMQVARAACAASGAGRTVYVLGGSSDGVHFHRTAECYSESSRAWSPLQQMEQPRGAFAAVSLGGQVYALGGLHAQGVLSSCERWDIRTQAWQPLPPMHAQRSELAAAARSGRVIAIGGFGDRHLLLGSVESFSPEAGCWDETMPWLQQPVAASASVVSKGRIYVLGGSDGRRTLPTVQILMPGESSWRVGPPMRSARMAVAAGACLTDSWAAPGPRSGSQGAH